MHIPLFKCRIKEGFLRGENLLFNYVRALPLSFNYYAFSFPLVKGMKKLSTSISIVR